MVRRRSRSWSRNQPRLVALRAPSGCLCDDPAVNLFDAFAVVFVVIAILLGLRSGALPQIGGLVGA